VLVPDDTEAAERSEIAVITIATTIIVAVALVVTVEDGIVLVSVPAIEIDIVTVIVIDPFHVSVLVSAAVDVVADTILPLRDDEEAEAAVSVQIVVHRDHVVGIVNDELNVTNPLVQIGLQDRHPLETKRQQKVRHKSGPENEKVQLDDEAGVGAVAAGTNASEVVKRMAKSTRGEVAVAADQEVRPIS